MSASYERIMGRAVIDQAFGAKLLAEPEATIKGSGLEFTDEEMATLTAKLVARKATFESSKLTLQEALAAWGA